LYNIDDVETVLKELQEIKNDSSSAENKYAMVIHISKSKIIKGLLTKVFEWSKQISSGNIALTKNIFKVFAAAITVSIIAILTFTGVIF